MSNSVWKPIADLDLEKEGVYMVYAPSDKHGKPYTSGNVTIMSVMKISNGYMCVIDGNFDFDTTFPTKYMNIDDFIEQAMDMKE